MRLQFALAVAKPGSLALLIDSNNKLTSREPIEHATELGTSFAVEVDDDVLALDADRADAAKSLESTILPMLEKLGSEPVLVASGGAGRRHLFARIPDAMLRDGIAVVSRSFGCDVRRTIRPPLAPHRNAMPVAILRPSNLGHALRSLSRRHETNSDSGYRRRKGSFSARIFELLRIGDKTSTYRSRSEVVQAVVLAAVNAGLPEELLWRVLSNSRNLAGEKVQEIQREKGMPAARLYVAHSYAKAVAYARKHPPIRSRTDALTTISNFERAADAPEGLAVFVGRIGTTDRAVLQGLISVSRHCGKIEFDVSHRQLCESAGISSRKTVRRSLTRLREMGLIGVLSRPSRGAIGRYRLRSFPTHSNHTGGV